MKTYWIEVTLAEDDERKQRLYSDMINWIGSLNRTDILECRPGTLEARRCEMVFNRNILRVQLVEIGAFTKLLIESKKIEPKYVDFIYELAQYGTIEVRHKRSANKVFQTIKPT